MLEGSINSLDIHQNMLSSPRMNKKNINYEQLVVK